MSNVLTFQRSAAAVRLMVLVAGAGYGLTKSLGALASGLDATRQHPVAIAIAEPVPRKSDQAAQLAADIGLAVTPYVGLAEDAVCDRVGGDAPIVTFLDSAVSTRRVLTAPAAQHRPVLVYFVLLVNQTVLAFRMVFIPGQDAIAQREVALFLEFLQRYLRPTGRDAIFGAGGRMGHKQIEPLLRRWSADHLATNLPKVLAGLPPTSAPFEATIDGKRTMPVVISHHPGGFRPPVELAQTILEDLQSPTTRGEDVAVIELDNAGIRFHFVRTRSTDSKVAISRGVTIDPSSLKATQEALARAVRYEINARNPASITD